MARIVVVGSIAVDEVYALGEPLRRGAHIEGGPTGRRVGGGAANTALPLAWAGHEVTVFSAAGTDAAGDWLVSELAAGGVDTREIARVGGSSTRSLILTDPDGERTVINVHRCKAEAPDGIATTPADAIYVRGRELQVASLLQRCLSGTLVVSHIPPATHLSRPAHVLLASESDFPAEDLADPWSLGSSVAGTALRWIVVTRGARGAEAFRRHGSVRVPAARVRPVDSTGAGDAFAAGLLHALVSGASMENALRIGNAWGAATVEVAGLPSPERIRHLALES